MIEDAAAIDDARLAVVQQSAGGPGRLVCTFDLGFLADIRALAGPDFRTVEERAADNVLASLGR